MSIKALPNATSRLLGSSQVLTTPASLVKELVDNALDAKATSIEVAIAANTVDRVEVRDNGHGIALEDISSVGRRGYTSKLRNFEELRILGGQSLGFRGEALASAVELGDISIITRTEGEAVATSFKLRTLGGIESQTSVSHPVGTTVCVANLFSKLPVRKQNALKDAKKTMSKIRETLQSYALARVNVRLTLKVLRNEKGKWSFTPHPNDGIREIVSQVIGRDTATQCQEIISTLPVTSRIGLKDNGLGGNSPSIFLNDCKSSRTQPQTHFVIHAFLPRPDADFTKISEGQYVSIDSRPVSSTQGSLKKIISIYKTILSAISVDDNLEKVKRPFIRLNICCPSGSYDPNVEPSKNNVLFEDEPLLLSLIEGWFRTVYGDRLASTTASKWPFTNQVESYKIADSINTVGGVTMSGNAHPSASVGQLNPDLDISERYDDDFELDRGEQVMRDDSIEENTNKKQACSSFNSLDPWVVAKLNASMFKMKHSEELSMPDHIGETTRRRLPKTTFILPTIHKLLSLNQSPDQSRPPPIERPLHDNCIGSDNLQKSLDDWLKQNRTNSHNTSAPRQVSKFPSAERLGGIVASADIENMTRARNSLYYTTQSPLTRQQQLVLDQSRNSNGPLVSSSKDSPSPIIHNAASAKDLRAKGLPSHRPKQDEGMSDHIFDVEAHEHIPRDEPRLEVYEALDFERRKEAATRKLRKELRQSRSTVVVPLSLVNSTRRLPLDNSCYQANVSTIGSNQSHIATDITQDKVPLATSLHDDDPRAYLMRRQKSLTAYSKKSRTECKPKCANTMLLPLEAIPNNMELHSLSQTVLSNVDLVRKAVLMLVRYDEYIESGYQVMGLDLYGADAAAIKKKLEGIVKMWAQATGSEQVNIVFELGGGLQGKCICRAQQAGICGCIQ